MKNEDSKKKRYKSPLLASIHQVVEDCHAVGAITDKEKERFDKSCLKTKK